MPVNYQKLYAYLAGQVDEALTLLEEGDLVRAGPVKELLQRALLTAEAAYIDSFDERSSVCIELLPVQKERVP